MRRKIAKRVRKEVLRQGAEILEAKWTDVDNYRFFCIHANYKGWKYAVPGYDELAAYKTVLECIKLYEDDKRHMELVH